MSQSENQETETQGPYAQFVSSAWCIFYGCGIIGCLVIYGVVQERIMSVPYGEEMFKISAFLVFCNRLVGLIYAMGMMTGKREQIYWQAPLWKYCTVAVSNVCATYCQYEALKYVSFPVQMLGKSFKMMPVMVWGIIISQKKYTLRDWCIAACITGGVTMFLMTGSIKSKHGAADQSWFGIVLLLIFLGCDGLTSTLQEKLFKDHTTSKYNQMFYINSCSACISLIVLIASNSLAKAIAFCGVHPLFIGHAVGLSAAAVAGQFFIYSQVKEFGALVFAATMNVRQVVSILISYAKYGHVITGLQILALVIVFGALSYKSGMGFFDGGSKKGASEKTPLLPNKNEADVEKAATKDEKAAEPVKA